MPYKYAVLGAGRQGLASAYDLAKFGEAGEILLGDIDLDISVKGAQKINTLLGKGLVRAIKADVSKPDELKDQLEGVDAFIAGVHYPFNLGLTKMAIDIGAT